jgi:hypothetical protein
MIEIEGDRSTAPIVIREAFKHLLDNQRLALGFAIVMAWVVGGYCRVSTASNTWAWRIAALIRTAQVSITGVIVGAWIGRVKHPGGTPRGITRRNTRCTVRVLFGRNDNSV